MRNKRWLRYGLASVVLCGGALGTLLVACGDDDSSSGGVQPDSGTDTSTGSETSTGQDGGPDANKPDTGTPAKLVVVNGATAVGPATLGTNPLEAAGAIRFCFATATKANPQDGDFTPTPLGAAPEEKASPSQPHPGVFIGTGGPFAGSGTPLEPITIRPYIFNAYRLAQGGVVGTDPAVPRCSKLLVPGTTYPDGGQPLVENVDYWRLADIPAGTLKQDKTYMLALVGCTNDANIAGVTSCGEGFTPDGGKGAGNLKVLVLELDQTPVAADEFGVQNLHLSPSAFAARNAVTPGLPPFLPTLVNAEANGDASADATAKYNVSPDGGEIAYTTDITTPTTVVKVKGLVTDTGYYAYAPQTNLVNTDPVLPIALNNKAGYSATFPTVQNATTGADAATAPPIYVNGQVYTFVLIGDPSAPAAAGPQRLHYIAFPNKQP